MTDVRVIVMSPEEAFDGIAEFWCGDEMLGLTLLDEGGLQLRIEARADGRPWLIDTASLARALAEASAQLAAY